MTVYIDALKHYKGTGLKHSTWCHMIADSFAELHAMADKLGMQRKWFQKGAWHPHYDLIPRRRARALEYGAVELPRREFAVKLRQLRQARKLCECNRDTCGVFDCDHCKRLVPYCCGAHDDIEERFGATCNDCAVPLGETLDARA